MSTLAVAEIGGTSIKVGFAVSGTPLDFTRTWPTARIRNADPAATLAALLRAAAAEAGTTPERVVATVPGFIDRDGDTVLHTANVPELDGMALGTRLSSALGLPVQLERDVVLQLLGEAAAGAVAGACDVLAVYYGTGIGAAYLGAAGIFRGGGWALELGHLPLLLTGRIEDVGSGARLAEIAAAHALPLPALFGAEAARAPGVAAILDDVVRHQALAAAAAAVLFSPRIILIGGGVPEMPGFPGALLHGRILASLPEPYRRHPPELRAARLGWRAAIHGALRLA